MRRSNSRVLLLGATSTVLDWWLLNNQNYICKHTFASITSSKNSHSYIQDVLGNHCAWFGQCPYVCRNGRLHASIPYESIYLKGFSISYRRTIQSVSSSDSEPKHISLSNADSPATDDKSSTRDAMAIQKILKSRDYNTELSSALNNCKVKLNEDLVVLVLRMHRFDWKFALIFFDWAITQNDYLHGTRAYNEMLDILGRMKQIRLMRQLFDEIPKDRRSYVINDKTFAILMNRYAGAHKVQEAIEIFYKRTDYGFELDMIGFQTLLMSLCRYKHVEEAEALFLQKQDEFPPVIKSRNIILNGWCVLGSLRDAKRFWNNIISSGRKPDLFTYGIFINALTKAGKLSTAVKLFRSMWEKGCNPDVAICNCIIDALCFKKKIPQALEIFSEMNERGCLPDVATYNSLIKHLCKIKRMQKVHELLNEMEEKGCRPNARTFCYILKTMEKPEEVTALTQRMERIGCTIDADTYNLILNLYLHWNYQWGIRYIWDEMKRRGLGPDQRSYTVMVHRLHSQGKQDEALQFYNEMRAKGMTPEPRTRVLVKAIYLKREEGISSHDSSISVQKRNF
ncbi:pentatricopeptide repeat-containing protein [Canna indica]|uniref:Pentatricopeptide repeat-containing protein n=1 Tax=Canna indica TaxID=4628 RepID=A0AAQ3L2H1_9LILI|nr:pentatricopeptide repeat-containing protein [Canna indica]